ncbi:OmpA family protein [Paragemmobacter straminiformis]|uniref:OmpA family protein n=1 Tax=Paragemmobacter straminiformis TaxID=2045119 RepID=A0A842I845_9RHOB|nr:OmpA family protein [Gemmobacter straminiformis]MBC2835796.1 OmpA family protein [Gemmobacter straminiformis]
MSKAPAKAAQAHAPHDHDDDHGGGGHGGGDDHGGGGHCPPPWIITFADMATLLMAFFVIMLMTATTDQPKFNAFASVMRQTFGRAPIDPNDADKGGTSIIDLHFGPQSGEQTNDPPATTPQSGDPEVPDSGKAEGVGNPGGATGDGASNDAGSGSAADQAAQALAKAMQDAVAQGELTVESDAGAVTIRLPKGASKEDAAKIASALTAGAAAANSAANAAAAPAQQGDAAGAPATGDATGAPATGDASGAPATGDATGAPATGDASGGAPAAGSGVGLIRAKMAAVKLGMALEEQMAQGDVQIEQRDGSVVVTVGAGGAFASGSADMTAQAQEIIAKLEDVSGKAARIVVTGHTDNVPLSGSTYTDNWELASARAASVVRSITESGTMPDTDLVAVSKGESAPVADNSTPEGRQKNRRIEIEIEFDKE